MFMLIQFAEFDTHESGSCFISSVVHKGRLNQEDAELGRTQHVLGRQPLCLRWLSYSHSDWQWLTRAFKFQWAIFLCSCKVVKSRLLPETGSTQLTCFSRTRPDPRIHESRKIRMSSSADRNRSDFRWIRFTPSSFAVSHSKHHRLSAPSCLKTSRPCFLCSQTSTNVPQMYVVVKPRV